MEKSQMIKDAQEILDWAISNMNLSIHSEIISYKKGNYKVHFFSKDNKFIMPVEIAEDWIKGTNPKETIIHDMLRNVLRNLENNSYI